MPVNGCPEGALKRAPGRAVNIIRFKRHVADGPCESCLNGVSGQPRQIQVSITKAAFEMSPFLPQRAEDAVRDAARNRKLKRLEVLRKGFIRTNLA